jgi:hypothetical protein
MKMNWFFLTSVAAVSVMSVVACSSTTAGTGGTGGTTGAGGEATTTVTGATTGAGGTNVYTGTQTCAGYISNNAWSMTLEMSDFGSEDAYNAWSALNNCACVEGTGTGCLDICSEPQNTTTTANFCNGVAALSQCQYCLNGTGTATGVTAECTTEYTNCMNN